MQFHTLGKAGTNPERVYKNTAWHYILSGIQNFLIQKDSKI